MERDNSLTPSDPLDEERLTALFRAIEAPSPRPDFAERTLRAVKQAPLPVGRRPLRNPLAFLFGWAAVVAGVTLSLLLVAVTVPAVPAAFTRLISTGLAIGVWLMQLAPTGASLLEVLATTSFAVSRAALTREGVSGLVLITAAGALSLSALHRLLISEGESSRWQEVS